MNNIELNNIEFYYYLATHKLSNEEYNKLVKLIIATGNEHVFNTKYNDIKSFLNDFLDGKYKLIKVDETELKNEKI